MITKTFNELMAVDVSQYVKDRDGAKYLPWAACKKLLHEQGAETVMFWPVPGPDGTSLRKSDIEFVDKDGRVNRCYEVVVHIQVDNIQWEVTYPVLNGNNPVKDNTMSQLRVNNAIARGFVKGVATRLGLGFNLWLDDEEPQPEEGEDLSKHSLAKCRQRMQELITAKINAGIPFTVIADRLGRTEDEVRGMMGWYAILGKTEKAIWEMMP